MDVLQLTSFFDELEKTSSLRFSGLWDKVVTYFSPEDKKVKKKVEYFFSPRAGDDRWKRFTSDVRSPEFVKRLSQHPDADPKLVQHAKSMHELSRGEPVGKILSSTSPGASYEIRRTPSGLACTCNDWRFKGSVNPGYECKHIRAHKEGKVKAAMERSPFSEQMSGFFDELTQIVNQKQKEKEDAMDLRNDRPYSSLLTQDEEPVEDYNPLQAEEAEPEVIVRGA